MVEVFISYSHKDESYREKLENHLVMLKRRGLISIWHDRKISPGDEWANEIHTALERSEIILLLVSDDFLASDYCYELEMKRALERHDGGDAVVVPIILRPVDWTDTPFSRLQALPKDGKPISQWRPKDKAYNDLAASLRHLISSRPTADAAVSENANNDSPVATRTVTETMGIELTIDRDFDEYSDADQRKLLEAIKHLIDVDGDLRVVSRERGSVKLRLEMTPAQAERLYWAVKQGKLEQFDVIDAKRDEEAIRVYESIGEDDWDSQVSGFDRSITISNIIEDLSSADNARRCRAIAGSAPERACEASSSQASRIANTVLPNR